MSRFAVTSQGRRAAAGGRAPAVERRRLQVAGAGIAGALEMVVWTAPPLREGSPLLVFSHGFRQEPSAAADLARRLAASGWIVGAPRHCDGRWGRKRLNAAAAAALRRAELAAAVAALRGGAALEEATGAPRQATGAPRQLALAGHSLGGATCLDLAASGDARGVAEVQALVLLSPALYAMDGPALAGVRAPVLLVYGEAERHIRGWSPLTKAELALQAFARLGGPCHLFELAGAGHYSFTARSGAGPLAWLRHGARRHLDLMARLAGAFLDRYVRGREGVDLPDRASLPMLAQRWDRGAAPTPAPELTDR